MPDELTPDLEERLGAWLADRAPREIPASFADRIASIPMSPAPTRNSRPTLLPSRRARPGLLAAALLATSLAIVGGGLFLAASQPAVPEVGRLLYERDGAIYLANEDAVDPHRIAEGVDLFEGSPWAPDGSHFLSYDRRGTADIRGPHGQVVASFPNFPGFNGYPVWSPDSTRLQSWTDSFRQIGIYGMDGVLQAQLPIPEGYVRLRETLGIWAPDGRSVRVQIARHSGDIDREVWELPIDGSAPKKLPEPAVAIDIGGPNFSRDGTRMAFSGGNGERQLLYVALSDGTDPRPVGLSWGSLPIWSPNGDHLAYLGSSGDDGATRDLMVVEVATGITRTLVPGWSWGGRRFGWSPDGRKVLFSRSDGPVAGLWTVDIEGGEATLLVEDARDGEWQPAPSTPGLGASP